MTRVHKSVQCLLLIGSISGCATFRGTLVSSMAIGGAAGFAIGYPVAPAGTSPVGEGALFAATGAAVGALAATLLYNPDKKISDLEDKNKRLEIDVKRFKEESSPKNLFQGSLEPFSSLSPKWKAMIDSGMLQGRTLNQWISPDGDQNHLIHQDLELTLIPPRLNPHNINPNEWKGALNDQSGK